MVWLSAAMAEPSGTAFVAEDGRALRLESTVVSAEIRADLAVVDVHQTFTNPFRTAVDAAYPFPLPVDAVLRNLMVTCRKRVLRSEIHSNQDLDTARLQGRLQQRYSRSIDQQDLFTVHIGGLCRKSPVQVHLQYEEELKVSEGIHTFRFPATLDPKASLALDLVVHGAGPLRSIDSDTHTIEVDEQTADRAHITLAQRTGPDSDVVIRWKPQAGVLRTSTTTARDAEGTGYVALTLHPPAEEPATQPRALVFVVGPPETPSGQRWQDTVVTVERALDALREGDTFDLILLTGEGHPAFPAPVPVTDASRETARAWLAWAANAPHVWLSGSGMVQALGFPTDPTALRMVVVVPDAYIGHEDDFFPSVVQSLSPNDRIFALGSGSPENRYLLDGLAHGGRGTAVHTQPGIPITTTVRELLQRIDRPVVTDLSIDWGSLDVELNGPIPDLFLGQPLRLVGRVQGGTRSEVVLHGLLAGKPWSMATTVDLAGAEIHDALPTIWARQRLAAWSYELQVDETTQQQRVTALALEHQLVSASTRMVTSDSDPGACAPALPELQVVGPLDYPDRTRRTYVHRSPNVGAIAEIVPPGGAHFGDLGMYVVPRAGALTGGMRNMDMPKGTVAGPMPEKAVQHAIRRSAKDLEACYLDARTVDPTLAGRIELGFVITSRGRTRSVEVTEDTLSDPTVAACMKQQFRRIQFAGPEDAVRVTYPIEFSPR